MGWQKMGCCSPLVISSTRTQTQTKTRAQNTAYPWWQLSPPEPPGPESPRTRRPRLQRPTQTRKPPNTTVSSLRGRASLESAGRYWASGESRHRRLDGRLVRPGGTSAAMSGICAGVAGTLAALGGGMWASGVTKAIGEEPRSCCGGGDGVRSRTVLTGPGPGSGVRRGAGDKLSRPGRGWLRALPGLPSGPQPPRQLVAGAAAGAGVGAGALGQGAPVAAARGRKAALRHRRRCHQGKDGDGEREGLGGTSQAV